MTIFTRNKILCQHFQWALATRQLIDSRADVCTSSTWVAEVALYKFRRCSTRLGTALTCNFRIIHLRQTKRILGGEGVSRGKGAESSGGAGGDTTGALPPLLADSKEQLPQPSQFWTVHRERLEIWTRRLTQQGST